MNSFIIKTLTLLVSVGAIGAEEVRFNRDVRPILSEYCYECHGPAETTPKGGLRLSDGASAKAIKDGHSAIVPGSIEESLVISLIESNDPNEQMPPPEIGKQISADQLSILKRWIKAGAPYETHWAFTAPQRPAVEADWQGAGVIDGFVRRRLQKEGLKPSPPADKRTLIRRVSLDLVGLPPPPKEVAAFVDDKSPDAYAKLVERLLASPHHGERMAQDWLDAARYADTTGYAADKPRTNWLYRDWVVKAFNDNMPFDQFTIEQLAGDMLPNATVAQKICYRISS